MLILKILDNDLHRSKSTTAVPLWIETPASPKFLPALISSSRGQWLVSRRLTADGRIRTGIFPYDSDRLDEIIGPMIKAALDLSLAEKWDNVFPGPKAAFEYVQKTSGTTVQPHACLVPSTWTDQKLQRWAGKDFSITEQAKAGKTKDGPEMTGIMTYRKTCRIYRCNTETPFFLSRPDFVGLFTQIVGGRSSVLLHNVRHGMAFCRYGVSRTSN